METIKMYDKEDPMALKHQEDLVNEAVQGNYHVCRKAIVFIDICNVIQRKLLLLLVVLVVLFPFFFINARRSIV